MCSPSPLLLILFPSSLPATPPAASRPPPLPDCASRRCLLLLAARCRDFTNAALPWGEPDWPMIQALLPASSSDGAPSNVLSVSFDKMTYPASVDGIHTVGGVPGQAHGGGLGWWWCKGLPAPGACCSFCLRGSALLPHHRPCCRCADCFPPCAPALQIFSTYGFVQKIHVFERDGRTTALVQYPDVRTADTAKAALEGHAMYDGGHNVVGRKSAPRTPSACHAGFVKSTTSWSSACHAVVDCG